MARWSGAFGIRVEMRLGHADYFILCDSYQNDAAARWSDHLAGPAHSSAGITDSGHLSQVIHGGFTNLHRHSVLGELNRSVVPVCKPILSRTPGRAKSHNFPPDPHLLMIPVLQALSPEMRNWLVVSLQHLMARRSGLRAIQPLLKCRGERPEAVCR